MERGEAVRSSPSSPSTYSIPRSRSVYSTDRGTLERAGAAELNLGTPSAEPLGSFPDMASWWLGTRIENELSSQPPAASPSPCPPAAREPGDFALALPISPASPSL